MNKWIITAITAFGIIGCGFADVTVYDDFSSGNLDKWTYAYSSGYSDAYPEVVDGEMVWPTRTAWTAYVSDSLTSTKSDFNLTATAQDKLKVSFDLVDFTPRTDPDSGYDALGVGWKDESGDILRVKFLCNNSSSYIVQCQWNGANFYSYSVTDWASGDNLSVEYDGAAVDFVRTRGETTSTVFSAPFSHAADFAGTGSIYLYSERERHGEDGVSWTLDNITAQTVPEPATLGLFAMSSLVMLFLRRIAC